MLLIIYNIKRKVRQDLLLFRVNFSMIETKALKKWGTNQQIFSFFCAFDYRQGVVL
jgi:hypothetical protein